MSTTDAMVPFLTAPWLTRTGETTGITCLPGLSREAIQGLEATYPGPLAAKMRELLARTCGLAGTDLGDIDFTGRWFPEEPLAVFRPCLTLAVDDAGRRWIAELNEQSLPGPVWCVFPDPEVVVFVSDDLVEFIATLRDRAAARDTAAWVRDLGIQAKAIWSRRQALATRGQRACKSDESIRAWIAGLPFDAYIFDLRARTPWRGWPYGLAGPAGRLYRCGRLPVFAVAGWPSQGRWAEHLSEIAATCPIAAPAAVRHSIDARAAPEMPDDARFVRSRRCRAEAPHGRAMRPRNSFERRPVPTRACA
ncbi:MAG TPA: hypothetical protein VMW56_21110 [Candidatus Margulisiibacteriota bacterium]|nr:hypothetical protein [Candidatus Margulisiibacteriota bacterium]